MPQLQIISRKGLVEGPGLLRDYTPEAV